MAEKKKGVVRLSGKDYKTVALRMSEFREHWPIQDGWGVRTTIHSINDQAVLFRAEIVDPDDRVLAVGHASGSVRGSKALEKCETTAIGRALAAVGLTGEEYASADEIAQWVADREDPVPPPKVEAKQEPAEEKPYRWPDSDRRWFMGRLTALGFDYNTQVAPFTESEGWGRPSGWGRVKLERFVKSLESGDVRAKLESFCNVGD